MNSVARILEAKQSSYRLAKDRYVALINNLHVGMASFAGLPAMDQPMVQAAAAFLKALERHEAKEVLSGDYDKALRQHFNYPLEPLSGHTPTIVEFREMLARVSSTRLQVTTGALDAFDGHINVNAFLDDLQAQLGRDIRRQDVRVYVVVCQRLPRKRLVFMAFPGGVALTNSYTGDADIVRDDDHLVELLRERDFIFLDEG